MHEVATDHLRKLVKLSEGGSNQIRIFEILHGRVQKAFTGNELVREVTEALDLYAEVSLPSFRLTYEIRD